MIDEDDICYCDACRRIDAPFTTQWVGSCVCRGADMVCFVDPNNWNVTCPDCQCPCSAETAPKIDGNPGYGHVVWTCNWLPCGWWWG